MMLETQLGYERQMRAVIQTWDGRIRSGTPLVTFDGLAV
jgi:hypothetical protein